MGRAPIAMTIDKTTRKSIFYLLPLLLFSLSTPLLGAENREEDNKLVENLFLNPNNDIKKEQQLRAPNLINGIDNLIAFVDKQGLTLWEYWSWKKPHNFSGDSRMFQYEGNFALNGNFIIANQTRQVKRQTITIEGYKAAKTIYLLFKPSDVDKKKHLSNLYMIALFSSDNNKTFSVLNSYNGLISNDGNSGQKAFTKRLYKKEFYNVSKKSNPGEFTPFFVDGVLYIQVESTNRNEDSTTLKTFLRKQINAKGDGEEVAPVTDNEEWNEVACKYYDLSDNRDKKDERINLLLRPAAAEFTTKWKERFEIAMQGFDEATDLYNQVNKLDNAINALFDYYAKVPTRDQKFSHIAPYSKRTARALAKLAKNGGINPNMDENGKNRLLGAIGYFDDNLQELLGKLATHTSLKPKGRVQRAVWEQLTLKAIKVLRPDRTSLINGRRTYITQWVRELAQYTETFKRSTLGRTALYNECYKHISWLLETYNTYNTYKSLGGRLDDAAYASWIRPLFTQVVASMDTFVNAINQDDMKNRRAQIQDLLQKLVGAIANDNKLLTLTQHNKFQDLLATFECHAPSPDAPAPPTNPNDVSGWEVAFNTAMAEFANAHRVGGNLGNQVRPLTGVTQALLAYYNQGDTHRPQFCDIEARLAETAYALMKLAQSGDLPQSETDRTAPTYSTRSITALDQGLQALLGELMADALGGNSQELIKRESLRAAWEHIALTAMQVLRNQPSRTSLINGRRTYITQWVRELAQYTDAFKTNNNFTRVALYNECYRHISWLLETYNTYKSLGGRLDDSAYQSWILPLFNKGTAALKAFVNASNKGTLTGKENAIAMLLNKWEKAIPQENKLKGIRKAFQKNVLANALCIIFSSNELPQYSDAAVLCLLKQAITKGRYDCYGEADDRGENKIAEVNRIKVEIMGRVETLQGAITDATRAQNLKTIADYRTFLDHFRWEQEDGLFLIAAMLTMTIIILAIVRAYQSKQIRTAFSVNILPPALEQEEKRPLNKPKSSKRKRMPFPTHKHTKRRQALTPSIRRVYGKQFCTLRF